MTATLDGVTKKDAEQSAEQNAATELVQLAKEQGLALTGPVPGRICSGTTVSTPKRDTRRAASQVAPDASRPGTRSRCPSTPLGSGQCRAQPVRTSTVSRGPIATSTASRSWAVTASARPAVRCPQWRGHRRGRHAPAPAETPRYLPLHTGRRRLRPRDRQRPGRQPRHGAAHRRGADMAASDEHLTRPPVRPSSRAASRGAA